MISDVLPWSPADRAGLRPRDIITAVDDASVSALPYFTALMYLHDPAVPLTVQVLRGSDTLQFRVPAIAVYGQAGDSGSSMPDESLVRELGIFGKPVDTQFSHLNGLRSGKGIYVVATTMANQDPGAALSPGDVIASLNGVPIQSIQNLHDMIRDLPGGRPAVLEIERHGEVVYVERELN
jgi:S1-C subfamily serine protease